MPRATAAVLLLSAVLVGCGTQNRGFDTAPDEAVEPIPPVQLGLENTDPRDDFSEPLPIPARKPSSETLLASRPDLNPERLIGLSLVEAEALLGEPALQDEKPPAKVWTYNAQSCVLSIFFYADISTRDFRALTYEIRKEKEATHEEAAIAETQTASNKGGEGRSEIADRQCLAELIKEHAT
ncbi:hypothetical protein [Rhodospirillaceae bacterium SYSU D60014]|uniref:hypothetical protein n=1 Tax=Virgifigura deserti TaxID=2268457 RepID=UPI000E66E3CC